MPIRVEMNRLREFIAKCDSEEEAREQVQNLAEQIRLQAEKTFLIQICKKSSMRQERFCTRIWDVHRSV
mgnify:CR=1 FL=1